jgi:phosphonate transport system permease protein
VFLILVAVSLPALEGAGRNSIMFKICADLPDSFSAGFFGHAAAFKALGETVQIAVMATFFAVILALPLAIAGAQNIAPRWLNLATRMILNVVRRCRV